jgi:hypothetical protein
MSTALTHSNQPSRASGASSLSVKAKGSVWLCKAPPHCTSASSSHAKGKAALCRGTRAVENSGISAVSSFPQIPWCFWPAEIRTIDSSVPAKSPYPRVCPNMLKCAHSMSLGHMCNVLVSAHFFYVVDCIDRDMFLRVNV